MIKLELPAIHFAVVLSVYSVFFPLAGIAQTENVEMEEVVVVSKKKIFANTTTTEAMKNQQNPITSVLATIDNLPGVNVTEGDTFGFDDWSTTINLRGFQNSLSEQQVGITIDGLPNGESNYGGGSKANRYIDSANMLGVNVSQGTADISSRSLEALGGTLNFLTRDPREEAGSRFELSFGEHDSLRYAAAYDTGSIFSDTTRAFISFAHQEATDWVNNAAENVRDHFAAKFVSDLDSIRLIGYLSYDDTHEDNYQRITLDQFRVNPNTDRLLREWQGIPYVDQVHRRGWSTLRENMFAYLKLEKNIQDNMVFKAAIYTHDNEGRGDWVPPQILDVIQNNGGPETEVLGGQTVKGGPNFGNIYFVDANGVALKPRAGCVSSITEPYGGAGPEYDPKCYPEGAIAVQSYRHTHYKKKRLGITADFEVDGQLAGYENQFRGGVWFEDQTREEFRDWHRILDTRVGPDFDPQPYYIQYDREYPRTVLNYYLEDSISLDQVKVTLGVRQFFVDVEREDNFDANNRSELNSDSDVLISGGLQWTLPVEGLELFASYSENYKALNDLILERDAADSSSIDPETSENVEVGLRYDYDRFDGSVVYFNNTFDNRLEFFGAQQAGNIPNYTIGTDGRYDNVGGIETDGFEVSGTFSATDELSLYSAFTYIDATYVGTGLGEAADAALNIVPGKQVVNTPEKSLVVSADWTNGNYRFGMSAKYVDERFIDRANTVLVDSYTTADAYAGINGSVISESLENVDMSVVINNLFDESYLGGISGFGAWIGSPRTAVFTVTAEF